MKGVIKIYDFFCRHLSLLWSGVGVLIVGMILAACTLRFSENIFAFLPEHTEYTRSMQVYSELSEASRIVFLVDGSNPDSIGLALDEIGERLPQAVTYADMDAYVNRLVFVCRHMPYFLTDSAYTVLEACTDSLTATDAVRQRLLRTATMLSMPGTSFLVPYLQNDPLQLIPLTKGVSGQYAGARSAFTAYNGYMMTADHTRGFAFYDSPYGSMESNRNALLVDSLQSVCDTLTVLYPSVSARLIGGPVVAIGNARRIKADCIKTISLSVVLLLALLLWIFPSRRDILWMLLPIAFGWLAGLSALAISGQEVSVIVLGIGSVLIGISANYPLHVLLHRQTTSTVRQTLQEVAKPLFIGNITTVGAFLALLPLHSPALQQLGLFASVNLIATIIFVLFVLPHCLSTNRLTMDNAQCASAHQQAPMAPNKRQRRPTSAYSAILLLILLPCVAWLLFSRQSSSLFDPNISHLNYMTDQQRADFAWFESLSQLTDDSAYLYSSACDELQQRMERWHTFCQTHNMARLAALVQQEATTAGLRSDLAEPFCSAITACATGADSAYPEADYADATLLAQLWPGRLDNERLNSQMANALVDDFDYLGLICSVLVFVFLLISFRSWRLALIAFVPMLLSWVVIIAVMQVCGLHFNIVNIILATFIFGQGDDYTIFVVEGLDYERRTGKPMLPQFRREIFISAIFMLVGIGVLVLAQHPAMFSLGAVTLIGMTAVVLMAILVPPLLMHRKSNPNTADIKP